MKKLDEIIRVKDELSGAYIEVWLKNGEPGARMNFFEDKHLQLDRLKSYRDAINSAIQLIETYKCSV